MRLKPAPSSSEALDYLCQQAEQVWRITVTDEIRARLLPTAEAMAAVAAFDVPSGTDPMLL